MARQRIMRRLARWHIWIGWLAGVPILMWTVTGLVMVARPIKEVRGEHLRAPDLPIAPEGLVLPRLSAPVLSVELVHQPDGPAWIVSEGDGGRYRYSAHAPGNVLPPVTRAEARRIAEHAFTGPSALSALTYFPADAAPLDLRRGAASWQARFADGTNLYIEDATGEVLAVRTSYWRVFDFMWGLHIMDLETREDTHHPILILFAALAVMGVLLGCVLMFRRRSARRAP